MVEFPFYRLATIGWANPLLRSTAGLLTDPPQDIVIDLSRVTFVDSFGVTYLAACFHNVLARCREVQLRPPDDGAVHDYLQNVGIYDAIGIGDHFGARMPSKRRVDLAHVRGLEPGFIDYLLNFLGQVQPFAPGLRASMRLTLLELVQNFAEHSGSTAGAWIAGQLIPHAKATHAPRITLCVLDLGRGIPNALRQVRRYRRNRDPRLIELSTEGGVSSVPDTSRGRGLSTIRRFAKANGGTLTILSGEGRVRFPPDGSPVGKNLAAPFPGSAIFLSLVPTARGLYVLEE